MTSAVPDPAPQRYGRIHVIGALVLAALAVPIWLEPPWNDWLRTAWLDGYQRVAPRELRATPVTVVEIDEPSLNQIGQWPWPRTIVADLVRAIAKHRPAVIGLDILMPEPDRMSPEHALERARLRDPLVADRLSGLPTNDDELARAIAEAPVVLAVAGALDPTRNTLRTVPFTVHDAEARSHGGVPVAPAVPSFAGALTSIELLDQAAVGHGIISIGPYGDAQHQIPLVASVGGTLVPSLPIEMLRVAGQAQSLRLMVRGAKVDAIAVSDIVAPTEEDGSVRVYFTPRDGRRFVSAKDVLAGDVDPLQLTDKLVLIGTTGIGLVDYQNTPLGERMPGSEVEAQVLENLLEGSLLMRPSWAAKLEAALFVALGGLLVWATPHWKPRNAASLALAIAIVAIAASYAVFRSSRLLFDAATPLLSLMLLFSVLLVLTLAEAARQRRVLERVVATQREEAAYIAGELQAAQRIQTGILPRADLFRAESRIDLAALMIPAREVGGDLYDFFSLDDHRVFFLIGDVAGKGLSASMFMAVSKALYKSAALKAGDNDIGELMSTANVEVSRDNSEMFFVTALAGVLDLTTGEVDYCNAGHENPCVIGAGGGVASFLQGGAGPPLCAVDRYEYRGASHCLAPGETLCMVTDGVTEAQNRAGELYGRPRLTRLLNQLRGDPLTASRIVDAVRADVDAFADGAEQSDDFTLLVLRWRGPAAGAA